MELKDHISYWLESAEHDLEVAENLFNLQNYDWCLFLGHLVLEKSLKALYVQDNQNSMPPKTHNLVRLAENTKLELTIERKIFFDEVNDFNLEIRYPEYKREFYKKCTKVFAGTYFLKIKDNYVWLKSHLKLKSL